MSDIVLLSFGLVAHTLHEWHGDSRGSSTRFTALDDVGRVRRSA